MSTAVSGSVGASAGRTPFKHDLMNRILGQTIGACAYGRNRIGCSNRWHVDDLCAGDGVDNFESGRCSPGIIKHHLYTKTGGERLRNTGGSATATLWERDQETFERLRWFRGNDPNITLRNEDSRAFAWGPDDNAVRIVIADPNNMHQLPIEQAFYDCHMPRFGSLLFTMGCNASGIKRLQLDLRQRWLDVANIGAIKRPHHEAILITLNCDSSQWGYLIVYPRVWTADFVRVITTKSVDHWPFGVTVVKHSDGDRAWREAFERLMLTQKELQDRRQPGFGLDDGDDVA